MEAGIQLSVRNTKCWTTGQNALIFANNIDWGLSYESPDMEDICVLYSTSVIAMIIFILFLCFFWVRFY